MTAERPFEMTGLPDRLRADFTGRLQEAVSGTANEREKNFLTRALAAFTVHKLSGCTLDEAAASVVDGGGDGGIDAIHYAPTTNTLLIVQSKYIESGRGEPTLDDVSKFRNGIEDLLQGGFKAFERNAMWTARLRQVRRYFKESALSVLAILVYSSISVGCSVTLRSVNACEKPLLRH